MPCEMGLNSIILYTRSNSCGSKIEESLSTVLKKVVGFDLLFYFFLFFPNTVAYEYNY